MTTAPAVLAQRVFPDRRVVTATLVIGFALLTAAAAQLRISLPFTPVPITGQTLAVLLSGAVLGSKQGAASQLLYFGLGLIGLPFYAGGGSGWEVVSGASGGYLVGFVAAAWVVGKLAEQQQDRRISTSLGAFLTANLVIYGFGIVGLMAATGFGLSEAIAKGMAPFIIGDTIKVVLAAGLLPAAWKLSEGRPRR